MKRDVVIAVLAVVAIALASLLTAKGPQGPKFASRDSTDYAFGGYHAWYDLLAREGVRVQRFRSHHDTLPESGIDTLIVAFPEETGEAFWDSAEWDAMYAWIKSGGRLIDIDLWPRTQRDDRAGDDAVLLGDVKPDHGPLSGPWAGVVSSLESRGTFRLRIQKKHHVETLLRDRAGILVVRYALGRGEVLGIAGAGPFENRALARGDDARLAYLAARPRRAGGIVAFDEAIRGDVTQKPWYRALNAPELVALGFLTFAGLLWLVYGFFPLGPPVRLRAPREPTSREFVDAVAALYARARARAHARDALVADARRNLERLPRSAANLALGVQVASAAGDPVPDDKALVAVALLSRTAREETIRAGRHAATPSRRTAARGVGTGRRR